MVGATPQNPHNMFGIVRFKHHHPRYLKTPFLAHGVQRYECLERHPRTHTIFFGRADYGRAAVQYQPPRKRPQNARFFLLGTPVVFIGYHPHPRYSLPHLVGGFKKKRSR